MCKESGDIMIKNQDELINRMVENLPVLRKKLKLSQQDLGSIIGSSRYTIMLYETRKRKLPWNVFMSLVLLFDKNEETALLLRAFEIYTNDLELFLNQPSHELEIESSR